MPVQSQPEMTEDVSCIVLRGNASLSGRAAVCLFALVALAVGGVGVLFALRGAWPVGAFSAATVLGVGAALVAVCRRTGDREVLIIDDARVQVIQQQAGRERRHEFQRYWLRTELRPVRDGWYPSRLLLRSHGREIEIGRELVEDERLALSRRLQAELRSATVSRAQTR